MSENAFLFRRARKIMPNLRGDDFKFALIASFDQNLRQLGFALDGAAAFELGFETEKTLAKIADEVIREAKAIKGVQRYRAMYPNFPKQVMEASDAELYVNAIMHYFGDAIGLRILPDYSEEKRPVLDFSEDRYKIVTLGSRDDFRSVLLSVVNQKAAYSEQDREDIIEHFEVIMHEYMQADLKFDNRENKAWFFAKMLADYGYLPVSIKFDTATDVLRLAVAMSGGDVSLAENTNFKSFKRRERRILLGLFENAGNLDEDFARRPQRYKRLGEVLHPREYSGMYPKANAAFLTVRNNDRKVLTFNSNVERALQQGDISKAVTLLSTRPGELLRRLDHVARSAKTLDHNDVIIDALRENASKASSTVLLQAHAAMMAGREQGRVFFPKGQVSKFQYAKDTRKNITATRRWAYASAIDDALIEKFKTLPSLNGQRVYVDPRLAGVPIPFGMRNASKGRTLARGARLPFDKDTKVLRFFIWWRDMNNTDAWSRRVDIDLSAVTLDANFQTLGNVAYYNLRDIGATHSGDITSAPNGASEFIDIDLAQLRDTGARYVAMTVHNYTGQKLVDVPECSAGYMERSDHQSGEIYEPKTVESRVDLTTTKKNSVPFIFDVVTGEAIWVDMSLDLGGRYYGGNNAASTGRTTENLLAGIAQKNYPNLQYLFITHAHARGGVLVSTPTDADLSFTLEDAFKSETILDKYL